MIRRCTSGWILGRKSRGAVVVTQARLDTRPTYPKFAPPCELHVPRGGLAEPGYLLLEDGRVFTGDLLGAPGVALGEAVFNTSMTGYQEVLTDPSYAGQIVTM